MGSFTLKSPEQQAKQYIEEQKRCGITGNYPKRYNFTLSQQQWIAPGYTCDNKIKGVFDCGLRTQTLIKDVWLKQEDLEMDEDMKGVVYGQG